ncbi:MAG: TIR domain-containing protein [Sandaracinaceae bacterium]
MSYPHAADREGEISEFRAKLEYALQQKTGERALAIFQDHEHIGLGESWRDVLGRTLEDVPVLMPIVQPLYLTSAWCTEELLDFHARVKGEDPPRSRILPVLWQRTPALAEDASAAAALLRELQYFDWSGFRLMDWGETKRLALDALAERIRAALWRGVAAGPGSAAGPPAPAAPVPPTAAGPPVRSDRARLKALRQLLTELFSLAELRRFVRDEVADGEDLAVSLPWENGTLIDVASELVEMLERRGAITERWWSALRRSRPLRVGEIDAVARAFRNRG